MLKDLIDRDRARFTALCAHTQVDKLYAFGSSTRSDFRDDSDIDVLVSVYPTDPLEAGGALLDLWDGLEAFFKRPVDLLTDRSIRNPYLRQEIDRTKVLVYDGIRGQILV